MIVRGGRRRAHRLISQEQFVALDLPCGEGQFVALDLPCGEGHLQQKLGSPPCPKFIVGGHSTVIVGSPSVLSVSSSGSTRKH